MVYCQKCGTKNDENADYCAKCGASLQVGTYVPQRRSRKKTEEDCFGLPNGGAIAGIVLGLFILLWGLTVLFDWGDFQFWPAILIIFGALMLLGAIYKVTHSKKNY